MEIREYNFLDIAEPKVIQIEVNPTGSILWVNIDGLCVLRVCKIAKLTIIDNRNKMRKE